MFVNHKSSIRHHNNSYDYENTNKSRQKPKIPKKRLRKSRSHFNHKLFSENFIFDPIKVSSKPLGTINIRILKKIEMSKN